ncbi:MAG TPA: Ig-like domain-containing protein, partial [Verrucomicrobiota bacterium]|nr:Ig-like domain-containing protein [Verrucomicrobiota bacterium]HNT15586.1 Ig-like domain-containing protein [Verrucomicrobiota bacterium]
DYQVVITNDWGSVTSAVATLAINLPPVANDDVIQVELGQTLNLVAAELLANDSDPDLDVLDLVAVQSPSLAGASVILTNDMVIYVAPVVGTNDNFSYTVADLWGATAVGTVQVTLVGWERPDFLRLIPVGGGDGQVRLRFVGAAGVRYALEQAHELSPPIIWTPLETNTTSPEGEIWFTNVLSAAPTNDYYRVRHAP